MCYYNTLDDKIWCVEQHSILTASVLCSLMHASLSQYNNTELQYIDIHTFLYTCIIESVDSISRDGPDMPYV